MIPSQTSSSWAAGLTRKSHGTYTNAMYAQNTMSALIHAGRPSNESFSQSRTIEWSNLHDPDARREPREKAGFAQRGTARRDPDRRPQHRALGAVGGRDPGRSGRR